MITDARRIAQYTENEEASASLRTGETQTHTKWLLYLSTTTSKGMDVRSEIVYVD